MNNLNATVAAPPPGVGISESISQMVLLCVFGVDMPTGGVAIDPCGSWVEYLVGVATLAVYVAFTLTGVTGTAWLGMLGLAPLTGPGTVFFATLPGTGLEFLATPTGA